MLLDNISDGAMIYRINDFEKSDLDMPSDNKMEIKYSNNMMNLMFQSVSEQQIKLNEVNDSI